MKSKITFFNLGNADTTLIRLGNGKNILWDFANMQGEKQCDLVAEMNKRVAKDYFDVVCFTHADLDHVKGMSSYFYLEHATKYQEGKRKKINELWAPAAIFLESEDNYCEDARILKCEAKYRFLTQKKSIKVFSKPDALKEWVEQQGVVFSEVEHLIVDAGKLVPGWSKDKEGIEFFIHSPFKGHVDDVNVVDRNTCSVFAQATFGNIAETKFLLGADADSDNLRDIVKVTKYHKNEDRLVWDIFHLCHHCSYKALNCAEKGKDKTTPVDQVKWLLETQGRNNCLLISPSDVIPSGDTYQPPHQQAHKYYKEDIADKKSGEIKVTMEYPDKTTPSPMEIEVDEAGYSIVKELSSAEKMASAAILTSKSATSGNWYGEKLV